MSSVRKNSGNLQQRPFSHHPALYRTLANRFTICTFLPADSAAKNLRADRAKVLVSWCSIPPCLAPRLRENHSKPLKLLSQSHNEHGEI